MQTVTPDTADLIGRFISDVTPNVIATMLNWPAPRETRSAEAETPGTFHLNAVTGSIGFCGHLTGTLFFSMSSAQASEMAGALLCSPIAADSHECLDVVGELTNMIAGGLKTRLSNHGVSTVMTIPSIVRGPAIQVTGQEVAFMVEREFTIGSSPAGARVIMIGKLGDE
ncbi:MAG TPA: hypothetical protein DCY13_09930 [Verrucomicrobiales bacterium]|nr:hypothetical protein [Verrucomicrobiales bacterium]